ncbi:hypothetical protein [Streptomyces sp. TLI_105]|uniref:hypothetical protein n=1 Tax=Streptomyces sp. TLI_105 TaxID=1881019 RepID=UPI00115F8C62|nr:hypothetical protein [Streptomyces sp. TLI_105]
MLLPTLPRTRLRSSDQPAIDTPFGPLTFTTTIGNTSLPLQPDELFQLPGDCTLARWVTPGARVELLLTPYDPELDPENWGPLIDCRAAVWRIDAFTPLGRVQFSAGLPDGADGGYDGGAGAGSYYGGGRDDPAHCRRQ